MAAVFRNKAYVDHLDPKLISLMDGDQTTKIASSEEEWQEACLINLAPAGVNPGVGPKYWTPYSHWASPLVFPHLDVYPVQAFCLEHLKPIREVMGLFRKASAIIDQGISNMRAIWASRWTDVTGQPYPTTGRFVDFALHQHANYVNATGEQQPQWISPDSIKPKWSRDE